uniref:FecR protein domain-containing protein n=1 Tax=candidate division WOR-3 bacterium TaxID=2052148 RepID=A0A7C4UBV8_UNCW3
MCIYLLCVYLNLFNGDVKVKSEGVWKEGYLELELRNGDSVFVLDGKAEIVFDDNTTAIIDSNTMIGINTSENSNRIYLNFGRIWAKVSKLLTGKIFEIEDNNCIAGVRGTEFVVSYNGDSSGIDVLEGEVEVKEKGLNKIVRLKRFERIRVRRKILSKIQKIDEARYERWFGWDKRDAQKIIERIKERREKRENLLERLEILQQRLQDNELKKKIDELREEGAKDDELIRLRGEYLIKRLNEDISRLESIYRDLESLRGELRIKIDRLKSLIKKREFKEARVLFNEIESKIPFLKARLREVFILYEKVENAKNRLEEFVKINRDNKKVRDIIKEAKNKIKEVNIIQKKIQNGLKEAKLFEKFINDLRIKLQERERK